jgi:cutinase
MRRGIRAAVAVCVLALVPVGPAVAPAASAACEDVEVIFARGTFEAPGVGRTGDAFVNSLRPRIGDRTLGVYAVNYPASLDFARAADGIVDSSNRIRTVVDSCPGTQIILGGYSQGAAVNAYVTMDTIPEGLALPPGVTDTLGASQRDRIVAVVLFGKPSASFVGLVNRTAPPITMGATFADKTLDLCAPRDPVCEAGSLDRAAHSLYAVNGMTDQAATFAARQLLA